METVFLARAVSTSEETGLVTVLRQWRGQGRPVSVKESLASFVLAMLGIQEAGAYFLLCTSQGITSFLGKEGVRFAHRPLVSMEVSLMQGCVPYFHAGVMSRYVASTAYLASIQVRIKYNAYLGCPATRLCQDIVAVTSQL